MSDETGTNEPTQPSEPVSTEAAEMNAEWGFGPMYEGATTLHETYRQFLKVGFDPEQALVLVSVILREAIGGGRI